VLVAAGWWRPERANGPTIKLKTGSLASALVFLLVADSFLPSLALARLKFRPLNQSSSAAAAAAN